MKRKPLRSKLYPLGLLLNPETEYVPAARTDIRRTFAKVRARARANEAEVETKVRLIKKSAL